MSKRLLQFLEYLQCYNDRPENKVLADFIRLQCPEGVQVDNAELGFELDKLLNLVKEARNVLKSKKSNKNQEENEY
jgi:hypothetical protein